MYDDIWRLIVEIHNRTKAILLATEELEQEFKDFLAPMIQQKDAFEHVIRAKGHELEMQQNCNEEYVRENLSKALGHVYRAFFDVADWAGIIFREKILNDLKPYTPECITAVLPEYYKTTRPRIEKICREIGTIRGAKDIGDHTKVLEEVNKYSEVIEELGSIWEKILDSAPALQEYKHKQTEKTFWSSIVKIIIGVLIGGAVTLLAMLIKK